MVFFYFVLSLGAVIAIFSGVIFNGEKIVGSKNLLPSSSSRNSLYHLVSTFIGILLTFSPMHFLGFNVMPRRIRHTVVTGELTVGLLLSCLFFWSCSFSFVFLFFSYSFSNIKFRRIKVLWFLYFSSKFQIFSMFAFSSFFSWFPGIILFFFLMAMIKEF